MCKHFLFATFLIIALLFGCSAVQAANIRIEQTWLSQNFASNGRLINTVTFVDADLITGIGDEQAPLLLLNQTVFQNNVGQNFNRANFTDPPNLTDEGNSGAIFKDGVFQNIFNVNNGGAARVGLINGGEPFNPGGSYGIGANNAAGTFEFIWFFPVSGQETFLLDKSATLVTYPQIVPIPGALVFLTSAVSVLAGCGLFSRKETVK